MAEKAKESSEVRRWRSEREEAPVSRRKMLVYFPTVARGPLIRIRPTTALSSLRPLAGLWFRLAVGSSDSP